jgi:REP element-mobilizing transposase RayT
MARRDRQLALSLTTPCGWGGRRPGAGRKPGPNPHMRHRSRERLRRATPAHVTLRTAQDIPSLRAVRICREIERTFARGCSRPGFRLVHYSLQGNHAHLIVEAQDRQALGRGMMAIASRLARAVNRVADRSGPVLADRYHVRLLRTPKEVRLALRYVLLNARHHAGRTRAGSSFRIALDPASSAQWFDGWKRDMAGGDASSRPAGNARPPVARARTWLLTVGWRRHGLLDPADVPGRPSQRNKS